MNDWTKRSLGEALTYIKTGTTPSTTRPDFFGGPISWYTPPDIGTSKYLTTSSRHISEAGLIDGKAKLFEPDTLLLTCIGDIGRVGIVRSRCSANQQVTGLKFDTDVNPEYAYYWFIAHVASLQRLATQAVVPILNNARLAEIEFSYPDLSQQAHVVSILEKVDRLRRMCRYALELGDSYLQALFLAMFGEPAQNQNGWDFSELSELVRSNDKINYGVVQPGDDYPGGIPIVRVGDFDDLAFSKSKLKRIDPKVENKHIRSRLVGDELLVSCVGTIGKVALVNEKLRGINIVRAVARIPVGDMVNRLYLASYLSTTYVQRYFRGETRTVSQPTLNIEQIETTPIMLPTLEKQLSFARIAKQYAHVRLQQREALRQAEHLFQTLLHRAFQGKL